MSTSSHPDAPDMASTAQVMTADELDQELCEKICVRDRLLRVFRDKVSKDPEAYKQYSLGILDLQIFHLFHSEIHSEIRSEIHSEDDVS